MPRTIVVTGTDTGVGKTCVTAGLIKALHAASISVVGIKPIESGCDGSQIEDGVLLAEAGSQSQPTQALLRLSAPLAPPLAADREGVEIDWSSLMNQTQGFLSGSEIALVEGAGGLLSPLSWNHNTLDLAIDLSAEVLLVASDKLGTLNHTLLTMQAIEQAGITVIGIVFSAPEVRDDSTGSNAQSLMRSTGYERVFSLPRVAGINQAAEALEPILHWLKA